MTKLVWDIDFLIFDSVSVAEERFIIATHIPTGRKFEFETRTKLWGHWKKREGGWIKEENDKLGNEFYKPDDFEVKDGQRPRPFKIKGIDEFTGEPDESKDYFIQPFDGAKKILEDKIKDVCKTLKTDEYYGFTGRGNVFRHDLSTLLYYKDRDEAVRPLLLDKMKDYVVDRHSIQLVEGLEADDHVNMAVFKGYQDWVAGGMKDEDKVIGVAIDKDSKQCPGWWFNPNKDKEPRLIQGFGSLWLTEKDEVDGAGRLWLYYQFFGDAADNYKANCFSDVKWGDKASYNALKDCKDDKEAWTALVESFKKLYPKPITVKGWRGDDIKIDWLYVLQEMASMAYMLRSVDDKSINVKNLLEKMKIKYD